MMSKLQWLALLCVLIVYLLLGACFFYQTESREEEKNRRMAYREMQEIEVLLEIHYQPSPNASKEEIFEKLTKYCGKPMHSNMSKEEIPLRWDFYHSLFFVITVVSTIGYGNLAPTTMIGRIFMIFYALVGIPINGMVMVTLGDFFAKHFKKLYKRWKKSAQIKQFADHLGLVGQITLYLLPGFALLIIIPSAIIMLFEGWDYDVAVYYAFVTLTTIGFGDYVAGVQRNDFNPATYIAYEIFLLVWIIIGLGYVVMVLGFISSGMRHKKVHEIEHVLSQNIRNTTTVMLRNLRGLLNQLILEKDVQPVYKTKKMSIAYHNTLYGKAYSLPDLSILNEECPQTLNRRNSESNLLLIDKDKTFQKRQSALLSKIETFVDLLPTSRGIDLFSEREILKSERKMSQLAVPENSNQYRKKYSFGDHLVPLKENEVTWYGQTAAIKQIEMNERLKHGRPRSRTLPVQQEPLIKLQNPSLFSRIKNSITSSRSSSREKDVEKQEICDNLRPAFVSSCRHRAQSESVEALAAKDHHAEFREVMNLLLAYANLPERKTNASPNEGQQTPSPGRRRRNAICPASSRRSSMVPLNGNGNARRSSLMPPAFLDDLPPPSRESLEQSRNNSLWSTPSPLRRHRVRNSNSEVITKRNNKF